MGGKTGGPMECHVRGRFHLDKCTSRVDFRTEAGSQTEGGEREREESRKRGPRSRKRRPEKEDADRILPSHAHARPPNLGDDIAAPVAIRTASFGALSGPKWWRIGLERRVWLGLRRGPGGGCQGDTSPVKKNNNNISRFIVFRSPS